MHHLTGGSQVTLRAVGYEAAVGGDTASGASRRNRRRRNTRQTGRCMVWYK